MSDLENKAYGVLKKMLQNEQKSVETIKNYIEDLCSMSMFNDCDKDKLKNSLYDAYITNIGITNPETEFLVKTTQSDNWMNSKKPSTNFFERYIEYLRDEDFPEDSLDKMTKSTKDTLARCADPTNIHNKTGLKKKGLVMGDVQSGKTANYTALINLAADYGYKVIVLLAGMTDSLRVQTQKRIDSGFIGAESDTISSFDIKYVGVGKDEQKYYAIPMTNTIYDYGKHVRESQNHNSNDFNKPLILVVKKNKSVLTEVKNYLKPGTNGITSENILIIDDEADNASVNTKYTDDPSIINKLIRDLFNNFTIASYVGFTATPFANIFINPYDDDSNKDLFPSDFIALLKEPSSYFGANKIFNNIGTITNPTYAHIEILDPEEKGFLLSTHKRDDEIYDVIPDSLKQAINDFIIVNVIRTLRGKKYKHRSMMVNISRFNPIQYKIQDKINTYIDMMKNTIEQTYKLDFESFIKDYNMKCLYEEYNSGFFNEIRNEFSWDQIQSELNNEIQQFVVAVINSVNSKNRFNYDDYKDHGARVIAIGGFILSRGLTLEGLMISYFNRKANAYDVVLQMCRWFGYRPGYEDLCRIYMSSENIDNFEDVVDAVENLKGQFTQMHLQNKTPEDFGLMVKQSPARLNTQSFLTYGKEKLEKMGVTAKNKMKNTETKTITLNYSGNSSDTSKIYNNVELNEENKKSLNMLIDNLIEKDFEIKDDGKKVYVERIPKKLISDFVKGLKFPYTNKSFDIDALSEYILKSVDMPEWDLVIANGSDKEELAPGEVVTCNILNREITLSSRKFEINKGDNIIRISGNKNRLAEPGIFTTGFSEKQNEEINKVKKSAESYLNIRKKPILVVYPLRLKKTENPNEEEIKAFNNFNFGNPLFGFALGFPGIKTDERVTFVLNKVKIEQLSLDFEYEEDYDPNED